MAVFLLFIMGNDIENIFVGTLIISAFIIPIMLRYLNIRRFLINGHYSKEKLIEYLSFGWPFTLIMISSWMLNLFNRYIIKIYCGSKEVGIYSAIFNLSDQSLSFIFMGLMLAVYPVLVKAWEIEGEEVTSRLITKFIRYYFILCLPVLIGLIILGDLVVNIFTTKDFEAGIKIIPYVAMSSFLIGLNQYFTKPLELKKRSKLLSLFMIVGAIINVSLAFILIPQYGLKGAAISTLISYVVLTLINWYVGKRYIKYLIPKISIIRVSIAVIFMGIIIEFLKNQLVENIFNLFFIIILSVFLYLLFLILIGEIKKSEITYLKGLIGLNNFSK
ncbi:MAG: polysaccharide biosynthesis C-terminal domain-containing protein [Actinobacteria bacterium]|nr:polysaccharide biosynthesis C-terminal domain-containing protein [Actinomycetota bacterium]